MKISLQLSRDQTTSILWFQEIRKQSFEIQDWIPLFPFIRWGLVFFKSRLHNDVRRFGRGLAGLFSQQNLLNLIKRCSNQHAEIFMDETNMRRFESVFTNRITTSWHQKSKISKRISRSKRVPQIASATEIGWGNRFFEISRRLCVQKSKIPNPTLISRDLIELEVL